MAAPNPYAGTEEDFDPTLHWGAFTAANLRTYTGEAVQAHDPSGEGFYSQEAGEESMQGVIDSKRLRGFVRYCLGYNNQTTSASYTLQRTNPICHPRMTNLVCTGVAHRGFNPIRSTPTPPGTVNTGLKIPRNDDTTGMVAVQESGAGSTPHTFPFFAGYDKEMATIRFSPAPYRFLADGLQTKEYYRNTIIDTEPRTEVLTLSGFQIVFAEGISNTGNTSNPKGAISPGDIGQVLVKPDLKVSWYRVPEKFISKNLINLPGQVFPEKIIKALGTLNKYDWISWKKGTLLCVGAHLVRKPWALAAGGNGVDALPNNARESVFNYDIDLLLSYFNPLKGYTSDAIITNADTYGHNNMPWRGNTPGVVLAGTDINQGRWFFATYSGLLTNIGTDTGDQGIYRYSAYDNIFDSVWNADIT